MNAIDKIAELHQAIGHMRPICSECRIAWPCPTRKLCDEADDITEPLLPFQEALDDLTADRDRWKADADRLAAVVRRMFRSDVHWKDAEVAQAALAAHDALTAETEGT